MVLDLDFISFEPMAFFFCSTSSGHWEKSDRYPVFIKHPSGQQQRRRAPGPSSLLPGPRRQTLGAGRPVAASLRSVPLPPPLPPSLCRVCLRFCQQMCRGSAGEWTLPGEAAKCLILMGSIWRRRLMSARRPLTTAESSVACRPLAPRAAN